MTDSVQNQIILGIDLGTTNSAVSVWQGDESKLIPNALGQVLTPSVVGLDNKGEVITGQIAKERLISHPEHTAAVFKRAMGTPQLFTLHRKAFTSLELSSLLLQSLKQHAEAFLGHAVSRAVISVPAYFNDQQRKATQQAAELAGLQVERLINEPTAAAIAYGLHDQCEDAKYMVLDLGGGTFDVTILEYFQGVMEVHASAGDNYLGGEDFTQVLLSQCLADHGVDAKKLNAQEQQVLYQHMEVLKRQLSQDNEANYQVELGKLQLQGQVTQRDYAQWVQPLLVRLMEPVKTALQDAKISAAELDQVILVGGASRMPIYRQTLVRILKMMPSSHLDPDTVVAAGAGMQAGMKQGDSKLKEIVLTDVAPYSLGTDIHNAEDEHDKLGGYFDPIIERNSLVPVSRVQRYYTVSDNQTRLRLKVLQGENRYARNNLLLGELDVSIPRDKAGEQSIDVRYSYDMNGLLDVDVTVVSTGKQYNAMFEQHQGCLNDEEKQQLIKKLQKLKIHPRDSSENRAATARLERLYTQSKGQKREQVANLLSRWQSCCNSQDNAQVAAFRDDMLRQLDEWEQFQW